MAVLGRCDGVSFDGSLGSAGALNGPNFLIPAERGKQVGGSLFHSFGDFTLLKDDVATFLGPSSVRNILARVTGGSASSIDGTLRSEISGANLYFINPAGVMFGANAKLDISGSFTVTTADYLKLADGGKFSARLGGDDTLTAAPVSAFGFLSDVPAPVSFQDSAIDLVPGQPLAIVAGDVSLNNSSIVGEGSRMDFVSVGSAGEARAGSLPGAPLETSRFARLGNIEARNFSTIQTSGQQGGKVVIRGGQLTVVDSSIYSDTSGVGRGGRMDVRVRGTLSEVNGFVGTNVSGTGRAGNVRVKAGGIELTESSLLGSGTSSSAPAGARAGDVAVRSGFVSATGGSRIDASTSGPGAGGDVSVKADEVFVRDALSGIESNSKPARGGPAGNVSVDAEFLTLVDAGVIGSTTFGTGRGGDVFVRSDDAYISNFGSVGATGILATSEADGRGGAGGSIRLETRLLTILDTGLVSAVTRSSGRGGDVTVIARDTHIEGNNSGFATGIFAASESDGAGGDGGSVRLQTDRLEIRHAAQVSANTFGLGKGGSVAVRAGSILVSSDGAADLTGITADSQNRAAGGAGGNVTIRADDIRVREQGQISANTFGRGDGGSVSIQAGKLSISGESASSRAGVFASTNSFTDGGHGGSIRLDVDALRIANGGRVAANTFGLGDAGDITIAARTLRMSGSESLSAAGIFAQTNGVNGGDAGNIRISADTVRIGPHSLITAGTLGTGAGGDIQVSARDLQISGSVSGINASAASSGNGGSIRISADTLGISHGALVTTATTDDGNGGALQIEAGILSLFAGGEISASTFANGAGGDVRITADRVDLVGDFIDPNATAPAGIFIESQGNGNAGSVSIVARDVRITGGAEISATAQSFGNAGDLTLSVDRLRIDGSTGVFRTGITAGTNFAGHGGTVRIFADEISVLGGGLISTTTSDTGDAGDIFVEARSMKLDGIRLLKSGTVLPSGISATAEGDFAFGHGGSIDITAGDLRILNGASVSAGTTGPGDGGQVAISARMLNLDRGGLIECASTGGGLAGGIAIRVDEPFTMSRGSALRTTSAFTSAGVIDVRSHSDIRLSDSTITVQALRADAGSIALRAPGTIALTDSTLSAEAGNNGGNIFIDPEFIILDHSLLSANAAIGRGGNIFLRTENFLFSTSTITATGATSGTVEIAAPELDIAAGLVVLPGALVDASTQLREQCARRLGLDFSSFLVIGRGGISLAPDDPLAELSPRASRQRAKPTSHAVVQ